MDFFTNKTPLNEQERNKILFMLGQNKNTSEIARDIQRSRKTVKYVIKKFRETGLTSRRRGSGREVTFDDEFRSKVLEYFVINPMKTYPEAIQENSWTCSKSWISKFLKQHNIRAFVAPKKPALSDEHVLQRHTFATITSDWTLEHWQKVIFSDEKTIQSYANGRVKIKRVRGAAFDPNFIVTVPRKKFAINMWGCMVGSDYSFEVFHVDKHFNAALYRYLLKRVAFPLFGSKYEGVQFVFQQDNASIHTARIIKEYFDENDIEPLYWPACSPDLSPIENLWAILQNRVNIRLRKESASNQTELFRIVSEESQLIDKSTLEKLYQSMTKRIQMLKDNDFKSIKY